MQEMLYINVPVGRACHFQSTLGLEKLNNTIYWYWKFFMILSVPYFQKHWGLQFIFKNVIRTFVKYTESNVHETFWVKILKACSWPFPTFTHYPVDVLCMTINWTLLYIRKKRFMIICLSFRKKECSFCTKKEASVLVKRVNSYEHEKQLCSTSEKIYF